MTAERPGHPAAQRLEAAFPVRAGVPTHTGPPAAPQPVRPLGATSWVQRAPDPLPVVSDAGGNRTPRPHPVLTAQPTTEIAEP
ncbi:MAG TPA: hypothetical protein VGD67_29050, partial [Pseudonocardiaceae bacterium]